MDKINLGDYKGIIFDLDGVIYDITKAIQHAVDDAIDKYKMGVNRDDIMQDIAHLIEEIQNSHANSNDMELEKDQDVHIEEGEL